MPLLLSICINAKYVIKDSLRKNKQEDTIQKHINNAERMSNSKEFSKKKEKNYSRYIKAKIYLIKTENLVLRLYCELIMLFPKVKVSNKLSEL